MSTIFTVSDFVAVFNQTIEYAYPDVTIIGELSNFKISKGKWVYFDLKDDTASVRFFGTIYALPGPLEDGMIVQVKGMPKLHQMFGFSIAIKTVQPLGEGSIKKSFDLLQAKLKAEGLFELDRKRSLPFPPASIGLIASKESAGYADFIKILGDRWSGVELTFIDVNVQGDLAPDQIVRAISHMNAVTNVEVLVLTRGGGSTEDLQVFSNEQVVRAVASSRIPVMVAVGHEIDVSLAELVADARASTPSNAAERLVPDRKVVYRELRAEQDKLITIVQSLFDAKKSTILMQSQQAVHHLQVILNTARHNLDQSLQLLHSYDPRTILKKGYAQVRTMQGKHINSVKQLRIDEHIGLLLLDGTAEVKVVYINDLKYNKRNGKD